MESQKKLELRQGIVILGVLGALTLIEYILALLNVPAILLWLVLLVKAGLVLWYFMHLKRIFSPGEGE